MKLYLTHRNQSLFGIGASPELHQQHTEFLRDRYWAQYCLFSLQTLCLQMYRRMVPVCMQTTLQWKNTGELVNVSENILKVINICFPANALILNTKKVTHLELLTNADTTMLWLPWIQDFHGKTILKNYINSPGSHHNIFCCISYTTFLWDMSHDEKDIFHLHMWALHTYNTRNNDGFRTSHRRMKLTQ